MVDLEKLHYADIHIGPGTPPTEEEFREISAFIKAHKEKLAAEDQSKKAHQEKSRPLPLRTAVNKPKARS